MLSLQVLFYVSGAYHLETKCLTLTHRNSEATIPLDDPIQVHDAVGRHDTRSRREMGV